MKFSIQCDFWSLIISMVGRNLFIDRKSYCLQSKLQSSVTTNRLWERIHGFILSDGEDPGTETDGEHRCTRKKFFSIALGQSRVKTRQLVFDFNGSHFVPHLCQPRGLISVPPTASLRKGVRWPIECEVIKENIQHIEWEPPEPEPFYQPTGYERLPMPVGEEKGKLVYCIDPATKLPYFTRSRCGGSRGPIRKAASRIDVGDGNHLVFESRFQSGNLQKAVQTGVYDYELTLRTDLYTTKHTQWFYFQVRNMKADVTYRFTIVNLMKSRSLYSSGMKPLLYSERAAQTQRVGWMRVGSDIKYYRNNREDDGQAFYLLTWTFQFPHEADICYLAHSYPYTYSDLQRYLMGVTSDPATAVHCKLRVLCHSLAGNAVYVLTVTSPSISREVGRAKRVVVVTSRVHPGETVSSWMMQGFLDFLLSDTQDAQLLRDTFVFKVVPMLNPDGVVVGNYRCSLAGRDLNRNYCTLLRDSFPCVWHMHNMMKRLMTEREVILYCDFHGHSRKNNVFMYGCDNGSRTTLQARVFPLMMSKNAADKFSYKSCKFKVSKHKEGTARIVMWKLGITNSYTMESTFGGSTLGKRKGTHFSTQDLKSLGYLFCDTLLDYCDPDPAKACRCLDELRVLLQHKIQQKLGVDVDSDGLGSISVSDIESSTSGSNSTESDGPPVHLLYIPNEPIISKKKHLKTRKERNRLHQKKFQSTKQEIQSMVPVLTSEGEVKIKMQEPAVEGMTKKRELVQFVGKGSGESERTWVSPSATGTGHITPTVEKPLKNFCLESAGKLYSWDGCRSTRQSVVDERQTSSKECLQQQLHLMIQGHWQPPPRQPFPITANRQRWLPRFAQKYRTLQPHPLIFTWDLETNVYMRGGYPAFRSSPCRSSAASSGAISRAVPEFMSSKRPLPSIACSPSASTVSDKAKPPSRIQPKRATKYFIPDASTSSETSKGQETDYKEEWNNNSEVPVLEDTATNARANTSSLIPDLKKHDLSADLQRSTGRHSGDQTGVRLGSLVSLRKNHQKGIKTDEL
ncbi:cytosolic carboxypeptidase 2-like isoform X2 [Paramormyrops kingsleyae]|uniref:cytosolic carboxypeptidase 2-like isoform X2 n=1 Tax=Paramormyrops kingsleyae TaxID=1676925 RepID=UPI003B97A279